MTHPFQPGRMYRGKKAILALEAMIKDHGPETGAPFEPGCFVLAPFQKTRVRFLIYNRRTVGQSDRLCVATHNRVKGFRFKEIR